MNEHLDDLIESHLRDEQSAEQKAELAELLDSNPDAARAFVAACEMNSAIVSVTTSEAERPHLDGPQPLRLRAIAPWLIATAACFVLVVGQLTPDKGTGETASPRSPKAIAVIINQSDAVFAPSVEPEAAIATAGDFDLLSGAVHLRFASGVDFVLAGKPAGGHPVTTDLKAFNGRLYMTTSASPLRSSLPLSILDDHMGVRVRATRLENRTAAASVMPNSRNKRPISPSI